jgi:hypothetical protein
VAALLLYPFACCPLLLAVTWLPQQLPQQVPVSSHAQVHAEHPQQHLSPVV